MKHSQNQRSKRPAILAAGAAILLSASLYTPANAAVTYIGDAIIPGNGTDLSGLPATILEDGVSPENALNGIGSGLGYAGGNLFYCLEDRGPNKVAYTNGAAVDNTTSYPNRFQQFTITATPVGSQDINGHYASYTINATNVGTSLLKNASGAQYLGISTGFTNNTRLDPETIRVAPDGTVWISDEYGPFILHFNKLGQQIGSLPLPPGFQIANPAATGTAEAATNTSGRVTNKGMEGLAISPDGKTLVGMMQDSLIQDGGANGTNVRVVVYDLTNPSAAPKQYAYTIDSTAMGISELLAVNNHKFLVDERNGTAGTGGIKKLYAFDLNQATAPTDLATTAYSGSTASNGLPATGLPVGVVGLQKTLFADIGQILNTASPSPFSAVDGKNDLPDKIEGYAWGPDLPDGRHLLLATNDNDFVQPGGAAGAGYPNYIFAFAVDQTDVPDFQQESFDTDAVNDIQHIVVVYQENWTFDGLYGSFPGANGFANATTASLTQVDRLTNAALSTEASNSYNNPAFASLTINPPPPLTTDSAAGVADTRVPSNTNTLLPYALASFISPTLTTGDIYHRYWQEQFQIFGAITDPVNGYSETGNNQGFVSWSDNPGLVMSHYDATNLPEGLLAQQYTICDNFFHSAFGGSFLNHQFLIAAAAPVYNSMPTANNGNIAYLDSNGVFIMNTSGSANGRYVRDGSITPVVGDQLTVTQNGSSTSVTVGAGNVEAFAGNPGTTFDKHYVVNTTRSLNLAGNGENGTVQPYLVSLLPSQNDSNPTNANGDTRPYIPTIGDQLSAADVSWKWYSGKWSEILAYSGSNPSPTTNPSYASENTLNQFQYHHQPFAYYDNYAPFDNTNTVPSQYVGGFAGTGTNGLIKGQSGVTRAQNSAAHLQDEQNFFTDVTNGTLPAVSFIKPVGINNEHPGYAALQTGQAHVASIVQAVQANPSLWAHTAIIVTYDEHGGRWDHVTPPARDIWGPGVRVPCIIISPLAKKGYVDHTSHDTSSILATIEQRFGVPSLNQRDGSATNLFDNFSSLDIARGGYVVNRRINKITQTVTITNNSSTAVNGPVELVLDGLSANTALANANGVTSNNAPAGSPYITVSTGSIAPGASVTVTLQFNIPTSGGVSYTTRTISGTTAP